MVELTNLCFQFLEITISPINCLSVINLAQIYDRRDIIQQAEQVVIDNFESVISSEMFPFITKSDLLRYMRNETYQTSWKAVVTWAKRKDNVQVSELVSIEQYPFKFLLQTVLEEPIVKNNKTAEKSVIAALFSDVKKLETNLDIDNCFILKNLSETNQVSEQMTIQDSINQFLETNFEQISKKNEFRDISKDDIIRLFKSSGTKYSSEAVKYEAMMKWVKHDVKNRRKLFQGLFSFIKLKDLSLKFLKEIVRLEPLVKKSDKCYDSLMDELFSRASQKAEEKPKADKPLAIPDSSSSKDDEEGSSAILGSVVRSAPEKEVVKVKEEFEERMKQMELKNEQEKRDAERMRIEHEKEMKRVQEEKRKMKIEIEKLKTGKKGAESQSSSQTTSGLRIINQQPSGGRLSYNVFKESLPGYEKGYERRGTLVIIYSFTAGRMRGVSYEAQEFTEYLPDDDGWLCYYLLRQAFDAGLIFKIQEVGDRKGKIVWSDEFPHKTNKTGGPENNGYPDPNHTMKLKQALKAKGFKYDIWFPFKLIRR
uniref:uncharacterized protein PFB0765w-like isoform X1 n=1 Tax=Styela clava TaxID=7725 RepID=UPI00193938A0|nr:uncharacterized protein PFB0765w-like isoform X1 [Styela clava]